MRAHQILETWAERLRPNAPNMERIKEVILRLSDSAEFNFRNCPVEEEHLNFAASLHASGELHLPYPSIFIIDDVMIKKGIWVLGIDYPDAIEFVQFGYSSNGLPVCHTISQMGKFPKKFEFISTQFINTKVPKEDLELIEEQATRVSTVSLMLSIMYKCGEYEHIIEKAPEKLNKARIRKGKPTISDKIYISLSKQYRCTSNNSTGKKLRTHYRRGHVMKVPAGGFTWRKSSIINEADNIIPRKPKYVVKP